MHQNIKLDTKVNWRVQIGGTDVVLKFVLKIVYNNENSTNTKRPKILTCIDKQLEYKMDFFNVRKCSRGNAEHSTRSVLSTSSVQWRKC